ncbi:MAG: DEAD/DEAH box helicase family protein [Sandaracinaceae bacterium]|nr:DEAD/DEAH box helicase family protein [Sandaracinaceae bacterium]
MVPNPDSPEQLARRTIDAQLAEAGWVIQHRSELNLAAAPGVAVREFRTSAGPADYALFLGNQLVGIIEAKRAGTTLSSVEAQTAAYAESASALLQVPVRPLPFLYESTGNETWFTNGLDPDAQARRVFRFHQPQTLRSWLDAELDRLANKPSARRAATLKGAMRVAPPLNTAGMWPAQIRAVENLEASFRDGKPRALVQMATGSGKTYTAISSIYRLVKEGGARRVLFLVDRGNLGRQALKEFQAYTTPDDGRKFTELYNVTNLTHNKVDPVNKVVITTIQRLYSILKGEDAFDDELDEGSAFTGHGAALMREPPGVVYNAALPPEFFDVVVVDECHRSIYSLWRQVLEYFDGTLVGLTATPASHTYAFFNQNVVSEYTHVNAVRDRVNVPYQVFDIRTRVTETGGCVIADPGAVIKKRDRATRKERWETVDEDVSYTAPQVDRSVVVPDQIRTVIRELKARMLTDIFPGRPAIPKTLIFAKSDDHAEDILRILREEWPLSNEEAVKVTYKPERQEGDTARKSASHKPEQLIQAFRNSYNPRVAVTVDMIATGTDIKPLECVVFMRSVQSRGLFEQMKGRGVRVIPDADFQAVTDGAMQKTHFVIVDCVGVVEAQKSDPPLDRERGISFPKLLEIIRAGNRDEDKLTTLAARLDRMDRKLTPAQRKHIEGVNGGVSVRDLVAGILDRIDPDAENQRARQIYGLAPQAEPSDEQRKAAQVALREEAAAPIAYAPKLCEALLEVRNEQEVLVDTLTLDQVTRSGPRADLALDYDADKALVSEFETFCKEHRDTLDALSVLYSRPYAQRLTRQQLMDLLAAIQRPPRQWTSEALWAAYERVERGRVRGASRGRMLTDLISLAKHAMGVEPELVSYADQASTRFEAWVAQQANTGRKFTEEQRAWLELIRDRIVVDLEVRMQDFDETPFAERGGLGKVWSLFGDGLETIVDELNRELVA